MNFDYCLISKKQLSTLIAPCWTQSIGIFLNKDHDTVYLFFSLHDKYWVIATIVTIVVVPFLDEVRMLGSCFVEGLAPVACRVILIWLGWEGKEVVGVKEGPWSAFCFRFFGWRMNLVYIFAFKDLTTIGQALNE